MNVESLYLSTKTSSQVIFLLQTHTHKNKQAEETKTLTLRMKWWILTSSLSFPSCYSILNHPQWMPLVGWTGKIHTRECKRKIMWIFSKNMISVIYWLCYHVLSLALEYCTLSSIYFSYIPMRVLNSVILPFLLPLSLCLTICTCKGKG